MQFYEVLETESKIYLVMEHLTAGELYDYILDQGKLTEEEGGRLFSQIVSAVAHCHRHGIVHRDLKPENILLTHRTNSDGSSSSDICKLVDFGLANYFDTTLDPALRSLHTQCGSPHYASPEILTGSKYSGPLSDIWSLGVLLFAMLCGSLPFNARSVPLLIKKIVEGKFKFPKFLSPSSRHLIHSILQIVPEQRPSLEEIQRHPWLQAHAQGGKAGKVGEEGAGTNGEAGEVEGGVSFSPPLLRPLSRPEVINPESGRPQPGDLQRLMLMHRESQRKVIGAGAFGASGAAEPLPRSDVLHFQSEDELLAMAGNAVSSPHPLHPGTPSHSSQPASSQSSTASSHTASPLLNAAAPPAASSSSSSSSFFADLLSFPSRGRKAIRCQFCGKTLNVRVSESGDLLLASSLKRPAAAAAADAAVDVMASKYELCSCLRTRSHSPSTADRSSDSNGHSEPAAAAASAASTTSIPSSSSSSSSSSSITPVDRDDPASFQANSFRENYFHPDDPRRKSKRQQRAEAQTAQSLSLQEQRRLQEEEAQRARNEERFLRACEDGDVDSVVTLIEPPTDESGLSTGPPLVDVRAKHIDNWTGLHYAARGGHLEVIQALLSSLQPLDINCRTKSSWSALMIAADKGHQEVCALLVRYGAAIHITNSDGKSAIFLARESGFHEIAQLLTHASSLRHKRHALLNEEKEEGEKTLNYELFRAAEYGDISKVRHLLELGRHEAKDHVSRRQGKDKERATGGGGQSGSNTSPPASAAAGGAALAAEEAPTRYSVDIGATGIDNWTALHFASRKGRADIVSLLLGHTPPCPVNAVTKNGWSALMMACDKGNAEVVRLLLDANADVGLRSTDGYSAWRAASEGRHTDIVAMLVEAARKREREKENKERARKELEGEGAAAAAARAVLQAEEGEKVEAAGVTAAAAPAAAPAGDGKADMKAAGTGPLSHPLAR